MESSNMIKVYAKTESVEEAKKLIFPIARIKLTGPTNFVKAETTNTNPKRILKPCFKYFSLKCTLDS